MAALPAPDRTLQNAPELRSFVISEVKRTGKSLGGGAFGSVEELEVRGLVCAGKRMYDVLVDPENQGAERMVRKYYEECKLMTDLRHPNIVQFLGICFLETDASSSLRNLPVLVMERLDRSLHDLLEKHLDVPLASKVSILEDVARGLVYLHGITHKEVIIHRDLTATNVLLDAALVGKIADLGNSRIVNLKPGQFVKTMTMTTGAQGTIVYMPPEAFENAAKCNTKLDLFSFGHLALFTAIQVFPSDLLPANYYDEATERLVPRDEVQRREPYMITLRGKLGDSHALVDLITQCLQYAPAKRPSASEALQKLQLIGAELKDSDYHRYHSMTRFELEASAMKHRQIEEYNEKLKMQIKDLQE